MKNTLLLLTLLIASASWGQQRITYDDSVTLTGTIEMKKGEYPFEGKTKETSFTALTLDEELLVYPGAKSRDEPPVRSRLVQLIVDGDHAYQGLRQKTGYRASVRCRQVDAAAFPMDFAPIVCWAQEISVSSTKPDIPYYDPEALCRRFTDPPINGSQGLKEQCLKNEQEGYDSLKKIWSTIPENSKLSCRRFVEAGKTPSYGVLNACAQTEKESEARNRTFQFKR